MRRRLRIEAADQDGAADAGIARLAEKRRHALGIRPLPVRRLVRARRHMTDVVAGREHQCLEGLELLRGKPIIEVIAMQERQLRVRRTFRRRLARRDVHRVAEFCEVQRGMAADQARAANDEDLHSQRLDDADARRKVRTEGNDRLRV